MFWFLEILFGGPPEEISYEMLWLFFSIEQVALSEWKCGTNDYIAESDKYRLKVTEVLFSSPLHCDSPPSCDIGLNNIKIW